MENQQKKSTSDHFKLIGDAFDASEQIRLKNQQTPEGKIVIAAQDYATDLPMNTQEDILYSNGLYEGFKAGAKWQNLQSQEANAKLVEGLRELINSNPLRDGYHEKQEQANVILICEAFNVVTRTGLTPEQMEARLNEAVELLKVAKFSCQPELEEEIYSFINKVKEK